MNDHLTTLLDEILAAERTDVATAVATPAEADHLAPLLDTARTLGNLPEPEPLPAADRAADRAAFLAQVDQLPAPPISPPLFIRLKGWTNQQAQAVRDLFRPKKEKTQMQAFILKAAASLMLVLGVGGGTAVLASDSQPDSPFYPVKLMMEDARLAMSHGPVDQSEQQMLMAQERVQEMTQAALDGDPLQTRTMIRLQTHLEQALRLAAQSPAADTGRLLHQMQEMLQVQTANMAQVHGKAGDGSQHILGELNRTLNQYQEQVQAALQDPQTFRWQYGQDEDFTPPTGPIGPGDGNCGEDCEPAGDQNQRGPDADAPAGPHGPDDGDCSEDCQPAGDQNQYGQDEEAPAGPYVPGTAGDKPEDGENQFGQDDDGANGPGYGQDDDTPSPGPGACDEGGCGSQDNHHNDGDENGGGDNSNTHNPNNGSNSKGG